MQFLPWMSVLTRTSLRTFCTNVRNENSLFVENLSARRSLIRVSGQREEVAPFLQGLITNDINHVADSTKPNAAMYTMFLNKPGRVMYEAIVYKRQAEAGTFYIECDRTLDSNLQQHLRLFRVRKKIDIDIVSDDFDVWVAFQPNLADSKKVDIDINQNALITKFIDPRLAALGWRLIAPSKVERKDLESLWPNHQIAPSTESSDYNYTQHRYVHGVCEGADEIPPGKCFPFDVNCDYLHGISFHKGCYLGQEFTARTYHTGVIRKRIMPIRLNDESKSAIGLDAPITNENQKAIGKLKGIRKGNAVGLLRIDLALQSKLLTIGDLTGTASRPCWWPVVISNSPAPTKS